MDELAAQIFAGVWKSFKIFGSTGGITLCNRKRFIQFNFRADAVLDIQEHRDDDVTTIARSAQWNLSLENNKHFLKISDVKPIYEVITVNHHVMVLQDRRNGEKIF